MTLKLSRELLHAISHVLCSDPQTKGILPRIPSNLGAMPAEYELSLNREKVLYLDRAIRKGVMSGDAYFGTLNRRELLDQWNTAVVPFLDPR